MRRILLELQRQVISNMHIGCTAFANWPLGIYIMSFYCTIMYKLAWNCCPIQYTRDSQLMVKKVTVNTPPFFCTSYKVCGYIVKAFEFSPQQLHESFILLMVHLCKSVCRGIWYFWMPDLGSWWLICKNAEDSELRFLLQLKACV